MTKQADHFFWLLIATMALLVSYCYAPMLLWNWFLAGAMGELTPLRSLALVLVCRVFVGIRTRDPNQSAKRDVTDSWATVISLWFCVALGWGIHWLES